MTDGGSPEVNATAATEKDDDKRLEDASVSGTSHLVLCVCVGAGHSLCVFVVERHALEQPRLRRKAQRQSKGKQLTERGHRRALSLESAALLRGVLSRATTSSFPSWLPIFTSVKTGARQLMLSPSRHEPRLSSQHQTRALRACLAPLLRCVFSCDWG